MIKIITANPQDFSSTDVLFQTPFWGDFKQKINNLDTLYYWVSYQKADAEEKKIFPLLVQIRHTKGNTVYAYTPRAPVINVPESERSSLLEELAMEIKDFLPKDTLFIRFDLPWGVPGVNDVNERVELAELAMNFGTKYHNLRKAPSNHLCPNTVIIDLRPSPEKLLASMRQQTRNAVRRSYKEEVEFMIYDGSSPDIMDKLNAWHEIYQDTGKRKGFYFEKFEYFKVLFESSVAAGKIKPRFELKSKVPLDACVPSPKFYLFTASKENKIISGLILAICGKTAYYMYAASSLENRQYMPNYGLQWEVIRFARSQGCTQYDLMGIPPDNDSSNPMAGLFIFKTGFGGRKVHFGGTWDFPYDEEKYINFAMNEFIQLKG
ncbi:MAG: peptidoglycan bridge formation glycyltransferase FemA/FemB family protein [Treponema sp.]|nr:peptidoglycan bridge formation glycyltransferase FemA/FemB family protein [Treponema sp.]